VAAGDGHVDSSIGSWRTGALVLVVAMVAGLLTSRLVQRQQEPEVTTVSRPAMGTLVEVSLTESDPAAARAARAALDEVARVDSLFSWRLPPPVQTPPAERDRERRAVLETGLEVQRWSRGAFDVRMMPLVRLWGFDGGEPAIPDPDSLAAAVAELAAAGTPLDAAELESRPGILHFGAWAKGYAVDRALAVLRELDRPAALVNAGGEVRGYGRDWTVGVEDPRLPGALVARLRPGELAVATSGDYQQYFERDGVRYHHLLDPRDGRPARGCRSVTILARSCARADALATAVFVLGPREGMDLVERLPHVEALIIDAEGVRHDSSGLEAFLVDD
jgi:thiamine biosynthesis lipoprotein